MKYLSRLLDTWGKTILSVSEHDSDICIEFTDDECIILEADEDNWYVDSEPSLYTRLRFNHITKDEYAEGLKEATRINKEKKVQQELAELQRLKKKYESDQ